MSIYTRYGDSGKTRLANGRIVSKDSPRIQVCGEIDELNSALGVAIAFIHDEGIQQLLIQLQHELFELCADIALVPSDNSVEYRIDGKHTEILEELINSFEARLPKLTRLVLPGGAKGAALLHLARAICRRAERSLVRLSKHEPINREALSYLNRLSDLLFVLARYVNYTAGEVEKTWD
ncbi:MAG: cob(I)yrinic acid a,c-diamide adenosyltransferase [Armatimonadota bacterium]|nr:cob(I)yrinic acid a,c-diamide adenosyltransferase [Armatimonadota bacterium]MDW8024695.1 cob(I)yrinic acid a,c-diamide adenosyltransferase [Armatimonadota bacterium]